MTPTDTINSICAHGIALADKATPGPWIADEESSSFVWPDDNQTNSIIKLYTDKNPENQALICAAPTLLPAALTALLEYHKAAETLAIAVEDYTMERTYQNVSVCKSDQDRLERIVLQCVKELRQAQSRIAASLTEAQTK